MNGFVFIAVFVILAALALFSTRNNKTWATMYGIVLAFGLSVHYSDVIVKNPVLSLSVFAGCCLIGFGYTFLAWFLFLKKEYAAYIKRRDEFSKTHNVDFSNSSAGSVGVPESYRSDFCSLFYHLKFSYDKREDVLLIPVVGDNVGYIVFSGVFWIFCLLDLLIGDGLEFVVLCCSRYYDYISKSVIK